MIAPPLIVPGRPGAASGLRPLTELREDTDGGIEHLVELRVAKLIEGIWSRAQGPVWSVPFSEIFDDEQLVVVGVQSLRDAGLVRVESLADCVATEGTFFADDGPAVAGARWGDGVTRWGDRWPFSAPTALYRFHRTGEDASGNGRTLTPVNGPTYGPAVFGLGAQLTKVTGASDSPYFRIPAADAGVFDPGTASFVVAVKFRLDSDGVNQGVATKGGGGGVDGWRLGVTGLNRGWFVIDGSTGAVTLTSDDDDITADGNDHSLVASVDRVANLARLYVDGLFKTSASVASIGSVANAAQDFYVGRTRLTTQMLDGRVDNVAVLIGQTWDAADVLQYHDAPAGEPTASTATRWGQFRRLYVHLPAGSSPRSTKVVAYLSLWLAERGQAVPQFGKQKVTDPGFESWLTASDLEHYIEDLVAGISLNREETLVRTGSFAARFDFDGTAGLGGVYESLPAVPGLWYRLHGEYRTDPEMDAQDLAVVRLGNPTDGWLELDGRGVGATAQINLQRTGGEWRRFYLDGFAHASTLRAWAGVQSVSGKSGSVVFDRLELVPIFAWQQAHPRLRAGSAPSAEVGTNDTLFGSDRSSSGEISAVNGDGFLPRFLASYHALGKAATFYEAGTFRDGQLIPADDWRPTFTGRTERPEVTDQLVRIPLRDIRGELHRIIPPRTYSRLDQPRVVASADGKPRPVFMGPKTGIAPVRIDLTEDGLGIYEVADTGWDMALPISPDGLKAIDAVYAYATKEAADDVVASQRALLTVAVDYSVNLARGTVTLLRHVGPFILEDDLMLDFDTGGSTLSATIAAGTYASIDALAATIQTAIRDTIGGGDTTGLCEFDLTLKVVRLGRTSGTFNLRASTGPNRDIGIYPLIGFASSSDQTGQSSYEGSVLLDDVDQSHVIRVDAQGYKDDASGTYTGSAAALITLGPDVARLVWHRLQGRPLSRLDGVSFAAARTARPAPLGLYLQNALSTLQLFQRLKISTLSDIVIDGAGRISYVPYTSVVPASVEVLEDRDYLSWSMSRPIRDIYAELVIEYDEDPGTGNVKTRRVAVPELALTAGRPDAHPERVYQVVGNDAQALARDLETISAAQPREVRLQLKSRLRDARPGTIVRLTRTEAFAPTGSLQAVAFRVASVVAATRVELRLLELIDIGS